ncbi:ketoacyl-ACP synthase III [Methylonatrum kenyense]|uniref:3-oxoacyl-ACP synthase III family protein n=1 Tax=Methylonatrum kenyense TaxID=455253 RepID=UPI0020C097AE|nr:ketoacyl-ACP synthase III [Methylonatrum kenyense]MCK8515305.1 ketoacyl-ACP synthase III [Methylonatrum kenyense]
MHPRIIAAAHYVPERLVSNAELNARFAALGKPEVIGKFEASSGILQRWYAPDDWATSDLALPAAREALQRAGRKAEDVDLLIVGTDSPDYITPATSTVLQHKLGAVNAGTFDVGCACASFPTGIATAAGLLQGRTGIRTVLVVGAYMMRKLADPNDPMIFFYGDGAGAAVMELDDAPGYLGAAFRADGAYSGSWGIYAGGTAEPVNTEALAAGRTQVRLIERYPPEINDDGWPRLFEQLCINTGISVGDVDHLIFTQVRRNTIELVAERIGLPLEKAPLIMDRCGYTGSACIPMALSEGQNSGRMRAGDLVVMIGSGVGFNQAAVALRL